MSLYDVEHVIHDMNVNAALTERFREAPQAVLADYALDESERAALVDGDVARALDDGRPPAADAALRARPPRPDAGILRRAEAAAGPAQDGQRPRLLSGRGARARLFGQVCQRARWHAVIEALLRVGDRQERANYR